MKKEQYNKIEYNNNYNKQNYKQFKAYLKNDEYEELEKLLVLNNFNKSDFIRFAIIKLKEKQNQESV